MNEVWAILPVKRLDQAKSRLSTVLDAREREKLARAMLCDVLDVLVCVGRLDGIVVVTNDDSVARLARRVGAMVVIDVCDAGTNSAVGQGLTWLRTNRHAGALILPSDIPFVTAEEVDAVISAMGTNDVVLVPALRDGGTNVLAFSPSALVEPSFGDDSYARHCAAATGAGYVPHSLHLGGAGHDIDVPSDLYCKPLGGNVVRTCDFLDQLALCGPLLSEAWLKEELQP